MIDGVLFDFQIIEEWDFALGEDACIIDEEEPQDYASSEMHGEHNECTSSGDVDALLHHLSEKWKDKGDGQHVHPHSTKNLEAQVDTNTLILPSASQQPQGVIPNFKSKEVNSHVQPLDDVKARKSREFVTDEKRVVKRTSSCPPGRGRSTTSGPWSLEWVSRHRCDDTVISLKPKSKVIANSSSQGVPKVTKKKGGGYLRHCAHNLKCIARLSNKDRKEVLRALPRTLKRRKVGSDVSKGKVIYVEGSSIGDSHSLVNNEWENWLLLHGNNKVMSDDVCGIGKRVGIKFGGDKNNMFDVLSGVERKIQREEGEESKP